MDARLVRILLIILVIVPSGIVLLSLSRELWLQSARDAYWRAKVADVESHKRGWSEQKIDHYTIGVHYYDFPLTGDCSQELIVNHNTVEHIISNTCYQYFVFTIDHLFRRIGNKGPSGHCFFNSCACYGPLVMDVIYDSKYYFPKTAKSIYDHEVRWMYETPKGIDLGITFIDPCSGLYGIPGAGLLWEVYSFTPIQQEP
jgi:hypothetical protein